MKDTPVSEPPARFYSLRRDTGTDHPLFAKMQATYIADRNWRKDIPKAGRDY